jgi:L-threonylcarbamoyladenylate synthase
VSLLRAGAIVAFPTDTLYGLAVDPRNTTAVAELFSAKGRAAAEAVPLIACDVEQVERQAGRLSPLARRLADRFWPGPLSLVIPADDALAPAVHAYSGRVAVRVPAHPVAVRLARMAGFPLTATSANRSGEPAATTPDEVAKMLADRIAAVLDAGPTRGGAPSTIVDVTGTVPRLVREGATPWWRVLKFLETL